jgi:DNA-directed RNA polymerase specialized sigma24 family protein
MNNFKEYKYDVHVVNDISDSPPGAKNLIIVAEVDQVLHFRIFDGDGKVAVDINTDDERLRKKGRKKGRLHEIEELRKQLESLRPHYELTRTDKDNIITSIKSIISNTNEYIIHLFDCEKWGELFGILNYRAKCYLKREHSNFSHEQMEDIISISNLAFCESRTKYDREKFDLMIYFISIVHHKAMDYWRQLGRDRSSSLQPFDLSSIPSRDGDEMEIRDLRLMSSVKCARSIPSEGEDLIIVAEVDQVLHFRIFDGDGKVAVDINTDDERLTEQAGPIEDLRKRLVSLWPPHELTGSEKDQVIDAVTSIVDHARPIPVLISKLGSQDQLLISEILERGGTPGNYKEIAVAIGCTPGTVRARWRRLKIRL